MATYSKSKDTLFLNNQSVCVIHGGTGVNSRRLNEAHSTRRNRSTKVREERPLIFTDACGGVRDPTVC